MPGRLLARLRSDGLVWALIAAMATMAAILFVLVVRDLEAPAGDLRLPWWALALAFAAAEVFVVHVNFRHSALSLSLAEVPLVAGLFLADPSALMLAGIAGPGVVLLLDRRHIPMRTAFNLAQFALVGALSITVFGALMPATAEVGPEAWVAALAATLTGTLVAGGLIALGMSLAEEPVGLRQLRQMLLADGLVTIANTCLALAGVAVLLADPRAAWLLLGPAIVMFLAYRAYVQERSRHRSLEFLYDVTRTVHRAPTVGDALTELLTKAREAFHAEVAEVHLFPADGGPALRTAITLDGAAAVMQPDEGPVPAALRRAVERDGAAPAEPRDAPGDVLGALDARERAPRAAARPALPASRRCWARSRSPTARAASPSSPRRPHAARDARQPHGGLARARPARAGGVGADRGPRPAPAPRLARPADRARQPRALHPAGRGRAQPPRRPRRRALPRPRRLQARQRPLRPRDRRRAARRLHAPPARVPAHQRPAGAARRRRVRGPARPRRPRARHPHRRAHPARVQGAVQALHRHAAARRQHRHRARRARRDDRRRAAAQRRRRHVRRQGAGEGALRGLRRPPGRAAAAPRHADRRARARRRAAQPRGLLPADRGARHRPRRRRRGARALAPPGRRGRRARRVHPARRALRPDRPDRRARAGARLHAAAALGALGRGQRAW